MENGISDFQRKMQEMINPFNLFLLFLEVVFIVLMAMGFSNVLSEPEMEVGIGANEISREIEGASGGLDDDISRAVYEIVAMNTSQETNVNQNGVVVRDGTVINKEINDLGLRYVSFIVDIPKIKQSYRVYYDDYDEIDENDISGRAPEVLVACLNGSDEMIYEDFDCKDDYNDLARYYVVRGYEEFGNEQGDGGYKVYLSGDKRYDGSVQSETYVEITAYCGDADAEKKAVDGVSKFFKELGFDLNDFKYKIVTECEYYNEDEQ